MASIYVANVFKTTDMRSFKCLSSGKGALLLLLFLLFSCKMANAQYYRFGVYISPVVSWFSTDIDDVKNEGARAGFNFNVSAEKYLSDRFSATGGISLISSGGRLVSSKPTFFRFPNHTSTVAANNPIVYRIRYLSFPVGIKYKTDEMGLFSYFGELGFDPKVVVRGRVDIPSIDIYGAKAMTEIRRLNLGYHLNAGIDYSLDGNISLVLGLGFENNFLDVTKDVSEQEVDRTSQKFLKFIFGVNFE